MLEDFNILLASSLFAFVCLPISPTPFGLDFRLHPETIIRGSRGDVLTLSCETNMRPDSITWIHNFEHGVSASNEYSSVESSTSEPWTSKLTVRIPWTMDSKGRDLFGMYQCVADLGPLSLVSNPGFLDFRESDHPVRYRMIRMEPLECAPLRSIEEGAATALIIFRKKWLDRRNVTVVWMHKGKARSLSAATSLSNDVNGFGFLQIAQVGVDDAGIHQVFVVNEKEQTISAGMCLLQVIPKAITLTEDEFSETLERSGEMDRPVVSQPASAAPRSVVKQLKPTSPRASRLSDSSVMLHWTLPTEGVEDILSRYPGLQVMFQKIQYKETRKGVEWNTVDEEIPPQIQSFPVTDLDPGKNYKFRIAIVFVNKDNTHGPASEKFRLEAEDRSQNLISPPNLADLKSLSTTAIEIKWEYAFEDVAIEGFIIHYRPTTNAGDYFPVTVLGATTRSHILSPLLPSTTYDVKIQAFNLHGVSGFSPVRRARTQGYEVASTGDGDLVSTRSIVKSDSKDDDLPLAGLLAIVVTTVILLLLSLLVFKRLWRRYTDREEIGRETCAVETSSSNRPKHRKKKETNGIEHRDEDQDELEFPPPSSSKAFVRENKFLKQPFIRMQELEEPERGHGDLAPTSCLVCPSDVASDLGIPVICRHIQGPAANNRGPTSSRSHWRPQSEILMTHYSSSPADSAGRRSLIWEEPHRQGRSTEIT